jgi:hypothetical protein
VKLTARSDVEAGVAGGFDGDLNSTTFGGS